MAESLLPQRFLFHFAAPCYYRTPLWPPRSAAWNAKYRLPSLAELEGRPAPGEVCAAWSEEGLAFRVQVQGKRQPLWCRASRPEDSDGVVFWIDTRDVHNVHRAGRFCHSFLFLPSGAGSRQEEPLAQFVPIHRARENPKTIRAGQLQARSQRQPDGYTLEVLIGADALTGFEPAEHPRLGFTYAIIDRELGEQTFGVGSPLPYQEDPSLWATLELVRE
jgi:hypothetical protein